MRVIDEYLTDKVALYNGDSAEVLRGLPDASIDLAVFSPPFSSLYVYSPSERDLGNSKGDREFFRHMRYITRELLRVVKPGRNVCVHVSDIALQKAKDGVIGVKDFSGMMIRHFERIGWTLHQKITIDKNPQSQAIRTKTKGLAFAQLERDSAWSRPAFADFLLVFRIPVDPDVSISPECDRDTWIEWASPCWYGIDENKTLNVTSARDDKDGRHICALQLPLIERCVRLWSNRGEKVLSPFAGVGSEGKVAVEWGRYFVGVELKPRYFKVACDNLKMAEFGDGQTSIFDEIENGKPSEKIKLPQHPIPNTAIITPDGPALTFLATAERIAGSPFPFTPTESLLLANLVLRGKVDTSPLSPGLWAVAAETLEEQYNRRKLMDAIALIRAPKEASNDI